MILSHLDLPQMEQSTKENSKMARKMVWAPSPIQMVGSTAVSSVRIIEMVKGSMCRPVEISTKGDGRMDCSMVKEHIAVSMVMSMKENTLEAMSMVKGPTPSLVVNMKENGPMAIARGQVD